jgi:hypothetical protein
MVNTIEMLTNEEELQGVRAGLEDVVAGRTRPFSQIKASLKATIQFEPTDCVSAVDDSVTLSCRAIGHLEKTPVMRSNSSRVRAQRTWQSSGHLDSNDWSTKWTKVEVWLPTRRLNCTNALQSLSFAVMKHGLKPNDWRWSK